MLETQTTLVGFTLISGTVAMQTALLFGSLYNAIRYPDAAQAFYLHLDKEQQHVFN
jgi:hypothetical protein